MTVDELTKARENRVMLERVINYKRFFEQDVQMVLLDRDESVRPDRMCIGGVNVSLPRIESLELPKMLKVYDEFVAGVKDVLQREIERLDKEFEAL